MQQLAGLVQLQSNLRQKYLGAGKIIATASSVEKLAHAKEMGADHVVNYTEEVGN